eukprot:3397815-Amphidinium_carterae.4
MTTPDFNKAAITVEDYYRNVYIDDNYSPRTHGLRGKYGKRNFGKGESEGTSRSIHLHKPQRRKEWIQTTVHLHKH